MKVLLRKGSIHGDGGENMILLFRNLQWKLIARHKTYPSCIHYHENGLEQFNWWPFDIKSYILRQINKIKNIKWQRFVHILMTLDNQCDLHLCLKLVIWYIQSVLLRGKRDITTSIATTKLSHRYLGKCKILSDGSFCMWRKINVINK